MSRSPSKISHISSSAMLIKRHGTWDLRTSSIFGTFLWILSTCTSRVQRLLPVAWSTHTNPTVLSYAHRSQVQDKINNSWIPVNMWSLCWAGNEKDWTTCVHDVLMCDVCNYVQDKTERGLFTEPPNWSIMALNTLMELSEEYARVEQKSRERWALGKKMEIE